MQHDRIEAVARQEKGRKTDVLRDSGKVPGVLYGFDIKPSNIVVDRNAFVKVYRDAGESMVIDLEVEGAKHSVLIRDIQRDVLTDFVTHVDFLRVDPKRKIEARIPLKLVGESFAVKTLAGTLVQALEEIEVFSLPDALVHEIEVDISSLKTFNDIIRVSDVKIPEGIELRTHLDQAVASVQEPRSEAEIAGLNDAVDADISKVEVLTEKKIEEGAEGAAPAAGEKPKAEKAKKE